MRNADLTAHLVVYNEEQWVWYAINSVLPHMQKMIIYDTDSTDKTVEIIKTIKSSKISFEQKGRVDPNQLVSLRNEQIKATETEWFMLLDGDEVWPKETLQELVPLLPTLSPDVMGVVVKARLPLGDLFHYQDESAGRYELLGQRGHYNIRAYRVSPGYHWMGTYPLEAYVNESGQAINNQDVKLVMLKGKYWHLRHLKRSSMRGVPKLEIGKKEDKGLPEVFSVPRPAIVPSPITNFTTIQSIFAHLFTPLRCLKRICRW